MPSLTALERATELKVCDYAEYCGCLVLKLNVMGRRGWPDRMIIYHGNVMFIEFKREGEKVKKLQDHIHRTIRLHGFQVVVVDEIEQGERYIDDLTSGKSHSSIT